MHPDDLHVVRWLLKRHGMLLLYCHDISLFLSHETMGWCSCSYQGVMLQPMKQLGILLAGKEEES